MKEFIQKNKMFVLIMSILSIIILSLVMYIYFSDYQTSTKQPIDVPQEPAPEKVEDVQIKEFVGRYSRATDQLTFRWDYKEETYPVESIYLYYNDQFISDVTSYKTWTIPREGFAFTTGANVFRLSITQSDGKVIEKETTVYIKKVVNLNQTVEYKDNKIIVSLQYQYEKSAPVDIPRLIFLDDTSTISGVTYLDTKTKDLGTMVEATTSYEFTWNGVVAENQQVFVRWSFDDVNDSMDYVLDIPNTIEEKPETKPDDESTEQKTENEKEEKDA